MPTKGGCREREKRLRFQIKTALDSNQDPFPHFQRLAQLLNSYQQTVSTYKLHEIDIDVSTSNYKDIPKNDPRRLAYK